LRFLVVSVSLDIFKIFKNIDYMGEKTSFGSYGVADLTYLSPYSASLWSEEERFEIFSFGCCKLLDLLQKI